MTAVMPAVFVGHGTPMNAIEDNLFSASWRALGRSLPRPQGILCVSAHWETEGTWVTAMAQPRTIHDFGGFPPDLYEVQYPAPGSPALCEAVQSSAAGTSIGLDRDWGLDHGCWSVLRHMYPDADVPVVQLSLDVALTPAGHYTLAAELAPLRSRGILVIGSGNMVHNLGRVVRSEGGVQDFNRPLGLPWAIEASTLFKRLIDERRHDSLLNYSELGASARLAVPTNEHFLPMLYVLALQGPDEHVSYFNDVAVGGSLTMTSFVVQ